MKNSLCFIFLFSCLSLSLDAQNNNAQSYEITSITGNAAVRTRGDSWTELNFGDILQLYDTDIIKVDNGSIKWKKNGTTKSLRQTRAISVLSAWNMKPSKNLTALRGRIRHQDDSNKDSIRIGFISYDGELTNNRIDKPDLCVAMVINQSTDAILYAYVFEERSDHSIRLLSEIFEENESICTIEPNYDNVFTFKKDDSLSSNIYKIHIVYSRERKIVGGKWSNIDQVYNYMSKKGFIGAECKIITK